MNAGGEACPTCNGERELHEDRAGGPGREHYTVQVPCPDCAAAGDADDAAQETAFEFRNFPRFPDDGIEIRGRYWLNVVTSHLGIISDVD